MAFSRVLSFILEKWHYATLSLLTGFVAGSLTVIWPWKIKKYLLGDGGEAALRKGKKILIGYEWHLPAQDQHLLLAVLLMLAGAGLVPILEFFAQNKPKPAKTPRE
jgi:putative membrane protein